MFHGLPGCRGPERSCGHRRSSAPWAAARSSPRWRRRGWGRASRSLSALGGRCGDPAEAEGDRRDQPAPAATSRTRYPWRCRPAGTAHSSPSTGSIPCSKSGCSRRSTPGSLGPAICTWRSGRATSPRGARCWTAADRVASRRPGISAGTTTSRPARFHGAGRRARLGVRQRARGASLREGVHLRVGLRALAIAGEAERSSSAVRAGRSCSPRDGRSARPHCTGRWSTRPAQATHSTAAFSRPSWPISRSTPVCARACGLGRSRLEPRAGWRACHADRPQMPQMAQMRR